MKEILNKKMEELDEKLVNMDEDKFLNRCCIASAGVIALYGAYMLGRWHVARYLSGALYLANEAGVLDFNQDAFNGFLLRTPEKVVRMAWKNGLIK